MLDSSYRIGSCGPHTPAVNGLKLRGSQTVGATSVAAGSVAVAMAARFGHGHDAAGAPRCTVLLSIDPRNHGAVATNPPRPRRHDEIRRCGDPPTRSPHLPLSAGGSVALCALTSPRGRNTWWWHSSCTHASPQCVGTGEPADQRRQQHHRHPWRRCQLLRRGATLRGVSARRHQHAQQQLRVRRARQERHQRRQPIARGCTPVTVLSRSGYATPRMRHRPGANVSSMSDNEAWPWTVWQWAVLVALVLLAAAVVAVDTHILFRGGWPLWPL